MRILRNCFIKLFFWLPSVLISLLLGSVIYIALSLVVQLFTHQNFESAPLYILTSMVMWFFLRSYIREGWKVSDFTLRWSTGILVLLGGTLILYRSAIYFHAIDDFAYHMIAGYYLGGLVNGNSFMPFDFFTYIYPLLQTPFYFLIDSVGIRFSLFFLSALQFIWFLHLGFRFSALIFPTEKSKRVFLDFVFLFIYFIPELTLSHVAFMSDFYTVLLALEALYIFLKKLPGTWMFIFMLLALLVKQSSGIFLIPLFFYMYVKRFHDIRIKDYILFALFAAPVLLFVAVSWVHTGNPLSFLLNSYFQSPLYALDNFRDRRWGPVGFVSILSWPLQGLFSDRYVEFAESIKLKPLFSLFLSVPYIASLFLAIRKRKLIYFCIVGSYLFWAAYSGYGRYHVAMSCIIILLLIMEFSRYIPRLSFSWKKLFVGLAFSAVCFLSIKNDYALRSFILQTSIRHPISPYPLELYKHGLQQIGKDRYEDIYQSIAFSLENYDAVMIQNRGVSTFYALLANKFLGIPVIYAESSTARESILASNLVDKHLKVNMESIQEKEKILYIFDAGTTAEQGEKAFPSGFSCGQLCRSQRAPQFHHGNYFNLVQSTICYKDR